jgi:hypothetical protein
MPRPASPEAIVQARACLVAADHSHHDPHPHSHPRPPSGSYPNQDSTELGPHRPIPATIADALDTNGVRTPEAMKRGQALAEASSQSQ